MWTSIDEFFYNDLAGIEGPDYYGPSYMNPGFRQIHIKPHVLGDLKYAKALIKTVRGTISSSWKKRENSLILEVILPVNSQAKVSIPKMGLHNVTIKEGGKVIWKDGSYVSSIAGISDGSESANYVIFNIGSGSYSFELRSEIPKKPLIEYSNLKVPESIKPAESFKVSAEIKNLSDYNLLPKVKLWLNSKLVDSKVIPLAGRESRKVIFPIKLRETGDYKVSIGSLSPRTVHVKPVNSFRGRT